VLESVAVRVGPDNLARIQFLRWDLRDFELPDGLLDPQETNWVLTLLVEIAGSTVHLWQGDGEFFAPEGRGLRHVDARESSGPTSPRWHKKSGNLWPMLNSTLLPFRGQFRTAEHIGYVFGDVENSTLSVLLQQVGEQDIEDHYSTEE
jgi:hypothetical protein